jgi:tRNA dimethylallyltransferase
MNHMNAETMKPRIVVICGPTGIGKTSAAIKTAKVFDGEIVSADSMQIYRHMDIGTAKPTFEEQAQTIHHMVNILEPDEPFNAAKFALRAHDIIKALHIKGHLPFIVGGTGLYIKALAHGLFHSEAEDPNVRNRFKKMEEEMGTDYLYTMLTRIDSETAGRLHPNDTFRIIRALEIHEMTGKTISDFHKKHQFSDLPYISLKIGLHMERQLLYERINQRVDEMVKAGILDEVNGLLKKGYSPELKAMQSIGYRHMIDFIKGDVPWADTIRILKRDTRRYAKRQLTWFRADPEIVWVEPEDLKKIKRLVEEFLERQ